jgi:hypothetical protein
MVVRTELQQVGTIRDSVQTLESVSESRHRHSSDSVFLSAVGRLPPLNDLEQVSKEDEETEQHLQSPDGLAKHADLPEIPIPLKNHENQIHLTIHAQAYAFFEGMSDENPEAFFSIRIALVTILRILQQSNQVCPRDFHAASCDRQTDVWVPNFERRY